MKWSRIGQVVVVLVAILLFVANIPQSAVAMGESTRDHYHVRVVHVVDDLNAFLTEQGFTPADYLIQPDWSAENPADWHAVIVRVVTDQAFQWEPNVYTWQDAVGRQFRQPQGHLTSRNYTVPMGAIDPEGDWVTWESPSYGGGYQREPTSYFMARLRSQAAARRPAAQPTTPTRLDGQAQSVLRVLEAYRTATSASDRLAARETFADALRRFLGRHPTANRYEVRARGPAYLDFVGIDPTGAACYGKATWLGLQMGGPLIAWEDFLAEVCAGSGVTASDPDLSVAVITSTVADMAKVYEMIREAADHGLIYVDITRYNISTGDYRLLFGTHPSQPGVVHLYDHHLLWVGSTTSRGASGDNVVLTRYERDVLAAWLQDASGTLVLGGQDQGGKEPFLPNEAYTGLHPVDWFESGTTAWTLTPVVVSTFEDGLNGWNQTEAAPYCEYIGGASRAYRTGHSPPVENETIPGPDIYVFRSIVRDSLTDPLRIDVEVRRASHPHEHSYGVYVGLWWNGAWHGGTPTYSGPPAFSPGYHTVTFLSVSGWKQGAPSTVEVRIRCINYDEQPVELNLDNIAVYTTPSAERVQLTTPPAYVGSGLQVELNATSGPAPGEHWGYAFSTQRSLSPATLYLGFYTQLSFWYRSTRNFRIRVTVDWHANPDAMTAQFNVAATGGAWQRFTQELYNLTYVKGLDPPLLRTYPDYLLAVTFSYPEINYVGGKNLWATGNDLLMLDELDCVARGGASLIPFLDTYIRNQPGADYNLGFGEDFHTYRWDPTTQRGHQNYTYWDATFDNGTGYFHVWAGAPTPPGAAPGPFTPGSLPRSIWWEANRGATWIQYVNTTCPTQKRWTFGLDMTNVGTTAQPQWVQAAEYAPRLLIEWRNHSTTLHTDSVAFLGALAAEAGQVWGVGVQTTKATAGFALDPTTPVAVGQFLYGPRLPDRSLPTLGTAMFHVIPRLNAYLGGTWYATSLCQLNQQAWQRGSDPRRTVTAVVNPAAGYVELAYSTAMATFESMRWSFTVAVRVYATDPQPHLKLTLTCHNAALDNLAVSYDLVATDWRAGYALTHVGVQLTDTGREYAFVASQVQDVGAQYATFRPRLRLASENQESFRLDFTDMATAGFRRPSLRVLDVALPGGGTRRGVQVGMTDYGPLLPNSTVVIDPQFVGGCDKDDVWAWRDTYDVYGGTDAGDLVLGVDEYGGGPELVEVIRYPLADAYVDSAQSGVNFGSSTHLWASVPSTKYSYFKFDLSGIPTTVVIAQLKVRIQALQSTHGTIKCYQVADISWTEGGIKWSNKPALGSQLATDSSGGVGSWDSFGVTSWAESCRGAGVMSLALTAAGPSSMGADYNSRESSGTSYDPYLYIAYYPLTKRADRVLSRFNITSIPDDPIQQIDSAVLRYSVPANGGSHTHGVEVRRATTWNWDSATASARWAWSALDPALTGAVAAGVLTCDVTSHVQAAYDAGAAFVAWRLSLVGDVNRNYLDWYKLTSSYPVGSCYLNVTYSVKPFAPTVTNLQILGRETDGGYGSDPAADNCYARHEYVVQVTAGDRNGWIDLEWVNVTIAETTLTYHYYWEPGYPPGRGMWLQELVPSGQITELNATHLLLSWNWTVPWGASQDATPISGGVRDYTGRIGTTTQPGYVDLIREVMVLDYTVDDAHVNPHQALTFAGTLRFLAAGAVLNRPYQGSMVIRYGGMGSVGGGYTDGTGHFVVSGYAPFPVAAYTMYAQPDPMGEAGGGPWVGNLPVIVDKLLLEQAGVTDSDWWLDSGSVFSWTFHCCYQWTGEHLVGWTLNWNGAGYTDTDMDGAIVVSLEGYDEVLAVSGQAVEEGLGGANITGIANTLSYSVTYTRIISCVAVTARYLPVGYAVAIEVTPVWAHNGSVYLHYLTVAANQTLLNATCYGDPGFVSMLPLVWTWNASLPGGVCFTAAIAETGWNPYGITRVDTVEAAWCSWSYDADRDGLLDVEEREVYGTNAFVPDSDGDLMWDGWELGHGLDPLLADGLLDLDGDMICNVQEYLWGLDPDVGDSDGDGLPDDWEALFGYYGLVDGFEGNAADWVNGGTVVFRTDVVHSGAFAAQFPGTDRFWVNTSIGLVGRWGVFGVWVYCSEAGGANYTIRVQVNGSVWFESAPMFVAGHVWTLLSLPAWAVVNGTGTITAVGLCGGTVGDLLDDAYVGFATEDGACDPDGDQMANLVEWSIGTSPFDPLEPGWIRANVTSDAFPEVSTATGVWYLSFQPIATNNTRFRLHLRLGVVTVWSSPWLDNASASATGQIQYCLPSLTFDRVAVEVETVNGLAAYLRLLWFQVYTLEDLPRQLRWSSLEGTGLQNNPRMLIAAFSGGSLVTEPKAVPQGDGGAEYGPDVTAALPQWWLAQMPNTKGMLSLMAYIPELTTREATPEIQYWLVSDAFPLSPSPLTEVTGGALALAEGFEGGATTSLRGIWRSTTLAQWEIVATASGDHVLHETAVHDADLWTHIGTPAWRDYTVDLRVVNPLGETYVHFRTTPTATSTMAQQVVQGYATHLVRQASAPYNTLSLYRVNSWTSTSVHSLVLLASTTWGSAPAVTSCHLSIDCEGGYIEVRCIGDPTPGSGSDSAAVSATDGSYFTHGGIGLVSKDSDSSFDDILVTPKSQPRSIAEDRVVRPSSDHSVTEWEEGTLLYDLETAGQEGLLTLGNRPDLLGASGSFASLNGYFDVGRLNTTELVPQDGLARYFLWFDQNASDLRQVTCYLYWAGNATAQQFTGTLVFDRHFAVTAMNRYNLAPDAVDWPPGSDVVTFSKTCTEGLYGLNVSLLYTGLTRHAWVPTYAAPNFLWTCQDGSGIGYFLSQVYSPITRTVSAIVLGDIVGSGVGVTCAPQVQVWLNGIELYLNGTDPSGHSFIMPSTTPLHLQPGFNELMIKLTAAANLSTLFDYAASHHACTATFQLSPIALLGATGQPLATVQLAGTTDLSEYSLVEGNLGRGLVVFYGFVDSRDSWLNGYEGLYRLRADGAGIRGLGEVGAGHLFVTNIWERAALPSPDAFFLSVRAQAASLNNTAFQFLPTVCPNMYGYPASPTPEDIVWTFNRVLQTARDGALSSVAGLLSTLFHSWAGTNPDPLKPWFDYGCFAKADWDVNQNAWRYWVCKPYLVDHGNYVELGFFYGLKFSPYPGGATYEDWCEWYRIYSDTQVQRVDDGVNPAWWMFLLPDFIPSDWSATNGANPYYAKGQVCNLVEALNETCVQWETWTRKLVGLYGGSYAGIFQAVIDVLRRVTVDPIIDSVLDTAIQMMYLTIFEDWNRGVTAVPTEVQELIQFLDAEQEKGAKPFFGRTRDRIEVSPYGVIAALVDINVKDSPAAATAILQRESYAAEERRGTLYQYEVIWRAMQLTKAVHQNSRGLIQLHHRVLLQSMVLTMDPNQKELVFVDSNNLGNQMINVPGAPNWDTACMDFGIEEHLYAEIYTDRAGHPHIYLVPTIVVVNPHEPRVESLSWPEDARNQACRAEAQYQRGQREGEEPFATSGIYSSEQVAQIQRNRATWEAAFPGTYLVTHRHDGSGVPLFWCDQKTGQKVAWCIPATDSFRGILDLKKGTHGLEEASSGLPLVPAEGNAEKILQRAPIVRELLDRTDGQPGIRVSCRDGTTQGALNDQRIGGEIRAATDIETEYHISRCAMYEESTDLQSHEAGSLHATNQNRRRMAFSINFIHLEAKDIVDWMLSQLTRKVQGKFSDASRRHGEVAYCEYLLKVKYSRVFMLWRCLCTEGTEAVEQSEYYRILQEVKKGNLGSGNLEARAEAFIEKMLAEIRNEMYTPLRESEYLTASPIRTVHAQVEKLREMVAQVSGIRHSTGETVQSPLSLDARLGLDGYDSALLEAAMLSRDMLQDPSTGVLVVSLGDYNPYYVLKPSPNVLKPGLIFGRGIHHAVEDPSTHVTYELSSTDYVGALHFVLTYYTMYAIEGCPVGSTKIKGTWDYRWIAELIRVLKYYQHALCWGHRAQELMDMLDAPAPEGLEFYKFINHIKQLPQKLTEMYEERFSGDPALRAKWGAMKAQGGLFGANYEINPSKEEAEALLDKAGQRLKDFGLPEREGYGSIEGLISRLVGHPGYGKIVRAAPLCPHVTYQAKNPFDPVATQTMCDILNPSEYSGENRLEMFGKPSLAQLRRPGENVLVPLHLGLDTGRLTVEKAAALKTLYRCSWQLSPITTLAEDLPACRDQREVAQPGTFAHLIGQDLRDGVRALRRRMSGLLCTDADMRIVDVDPCTPYDADHLTAQGFDGDALSYDRILARSTLNVLKVLMDATLPGEWDTMLSALSHPDQYPEQARWMGILSDMLGHREVLSAVEGAVEMASSRTVWRRIGGELRQSAAAVGSQVFLSGHNNMILFLLFFAPIGIAIGEYIAYTQGRGAGDFAPANALYNLDPAAKWTTAVSTGLLTFVTDYIDVVRFKNKLADAFKLHMAARSWGLGSLDLASEVMNCVFGGYQMGTAGWLGSPSADAEAGKPASYFPQLNYDFDYYYFDPENAPDQMRYWLAADTSEGGMGWTFLADDSPAPIGAYVYYWAWKAVFLSIGAVLFYVEKRYVGGLVSSWKDCALAAIVSWLSNFFAQKIIDVFIIGLPAWLLGQASALPTYDLLENPDAPPTYNLIYEWGAWGYWRPDLISA